MTKGGKLNEGIFEGETINTPSMLCVEDYIDALEWAKSIGGQSGMTKRANANLAAVEKWVAKTPWAEFLARDKATRSNTSICIAVVDPAIEALSPDAKFNFIRGMAAMLEKEDAAYDVAGHRDAPPHIRIWGGATVETSDIEALLPWLEWAFAESKAALSKAA
jgi:phosphoserine aminotransferase